MMAIPNKEHQEVNECFKQRRLLVQNCTCGLLSLGEEGKRNGWKEEEEGEG